ncbi:Non-homologous end joining protein Ku [Streptomyces alboniger]
MRSIWNGAVSFGLVSIPVKLVNATENHSVSFRQVHMEDGGRIRYRKVCEAEDREVTSAEIGKGYRNADGTIIPITDEDLAALPIPTAKTIEIVAFVPADRVDPLQMDTAYYLSANGVPATKPYTLLREALRRSDKVALARYALRGRERLGMLRVVDDVIAMHGLLWPDEIRQPEGAAPEARVTVRDAELDLADALMDTLGEVDIATLHDDYRSAVEELVAAKVQGGTATERAPAADAGGGKVIDLMAALENSVRAARAGAGAPGASGADGSVAEVTRLPARRAKKTAAAGKTAPRRTATKPRTPAAKTPDGTPPDEPAPPSASKKAAAGKTAAARTGGTARPSPGRTAGSATSSSGASGGKAAGSGASGSGASGSRTSGSGASGGKAAGSGNSGGGNSRSKTAGSGNSGSEAARSGASGSKTSAKDSSARKSTAKDTPARKTAAKKTAGKNAPPAKKSAAAKKSAPAKKSAAKRRASA